jgi:putative transposase
MKPTRFMEEQIIWILNEAEAGAKTPALARRHGVSEATIYNRKAKHGGLDLQPAVLRLPLVERRTADPVPPADFGCRHAGLLLLNDRDDLLV